MPTIDAITVTPGNAASPGAITGTLPSGSGDLLVAFVMYDNVTVTAPGWTVQDSRIVGATADIGVTMLTAPSNVSSLTFTPSDTGRTGVVVIYRVSGAGGVHAVAGIGALGNTTATTRAIPTVTTTVNDCLLISGVGCDSNSGTGYTWPAPWSEQTDDGVVGDTGLRCSTASTTQATAGTTPGGNVTFSASDHHGIITIALEPSTDTTKEGFATGDYAFAGAASGDNDGINLPGLIDGVEPEAAGSFRGPFMDSNGNLYTVTEEYLGAGGAGFGNHPMMMKSANGGETWTRVDAAGGPGYGVGGSYNDMESAWTIHNPGANELVLCYMKGQSRWWGVRFRTSDHPTNPDTWDSSTFATSSGQDQFATQASESGIAAALLSDGRVRAFIRGEPQSTFQAFLHRERTAGGTWSTGTNYYTDGSRSIVRPSAIAVGTTTYLFYRDHTNGQVRFNTFNSSGTAGTSARVDSGGAGSGDTYMNNVVPPVAYDDAGTSVVVVGFVNASNQLRTVEVRGGVVGSEQVVSTDTVTLNPNGSGGSTDNQGPSAALAVHGNILYALWGDNTSGDLYYATRPNGGSWSARTLLTDTGSGNAVHWLYANVITKPDTTKRIAFTYDIGPHADDDSNTWYNELAPISREGSVARTVDWAGSATGVELAQGTVLESYSLDGSAVGQRVATGVSTAAHDWAGTATGVTGSGTGLLDVLLIHDDPTPTTGDTRLQEWLESAGHTVTLLSETANAPTSGYDVAVVGSSVAATVPDKYANVSYGFLNMEIGGWINGGLTSANATTYADAGVYALTSHQITQGLSTPQDFHAVANSHSVDISTLASGVTAIAVADADPTKVVLFIADTGATLHTGFGTAAGRRACLGWADGNLNVINNSSTAIDLFLRTVAWLGNVAGPPGEGLATTGVVPSYVAHTIADATDDLITLAAPAGVQAGDIQIVLFGTAADDEPLTHTPAGWTKLAGLDHWHGNPDGNSATHRAELYISATDTGPATFRRIFYTGNRVMFAYRVAYRGATGYADATLVNTDDPSDGGPFTQHPFTAIADSIKNSLIVAGVFTEDSSLPTWTPPTLFTERIDSQYSVVEHDDPLSFTLADRVSPGGAVSGTFVSSLACYGSVFSMRLLNEPTYDFIGTASGAMPKYGAATGGFNASGTATGNYPAKGSASGGYAFAGSAAGTKTQKASATGGFALAGGATGTKTPQGTSTSTLDFTGSSDGVTTPLGVQDGTASGGYAFAGTAVGDVPPNTGVLNAEYSFSWFGFTTGGVRTPVATGGGTYDLTGSATGITPGPLAKLGDATGTAAWAGTGVGQRAPKATATGGYAYLGSASQAVLAQDITITSVAEPTLVLTATGPVPGVWTSATPENEVYQLAQPEAVWSTSEPRL